MRLIKVAAVLAALILAAPADATVSTVPVALSAASWTDLGAGPLRIFVTGAGNAWYQIADSQPSLASAGLPLSGPALDVQTSSHVWALAGPGPTPTLLVSPITSWGGGSGGTVTLGAGSATVGAVTQAGGPWSVTPTLFAPGSSYAQLAVGATSARVALPTGAEVAVYNTGSYAAFVALGSSSVTATASGDQIAPGGFLCLAPGSATYLAAIETAGATSLNLSGGSGACAGSGGGGGSGGTTKVWDGTNTAAVKAASAAPAAADPSMVVTLSPNAPIQWGAGSSNNGQLQAPLTLLSSANESAFSSLTTGSYLQSSVSGTSGVFTNANTAQAQFGDLVFTSGGTIAPTAGANLTIWFNKTDGTNYAACNQYIARAPDAIIPLGTSVVASTSYWSSGTHSIRVPAYPFKVCIQNNTGVTLASSGNTLTLISPITNW